MVHFVNESDLNRTILMVFQKVEKIEYWVVIKHLSLKNKNNGEVKV